MPSRRVSTAVVRVRMIVQLAGETLAAHDGATSGLDVDPSSTTAAEAAAGASAPPSVATVAVIKSRFICPLNTRTTMQLRPDRRRTGRNCWICTYEMYRPARRHLDGTRRRPRLFTP